MHKTKGEQHLLAISGRWWLTEVVTDALLKRHYPSVSRRLVTNPGARMSASGYAIVLKQAESDPELAVETGIRVDLPADQRQQLLRSATEAVRARLLSRAPPHLFEDIRNAIALAAAGANREMSRTRDFTAARRFVAALAKHGKLNEPALLAFAKERKYAETVAALAELSGSTIEMIRPVMQSLRDDGVLIPCRVAGLNWETVAAVLDSRFASGSMGRHELAKAKEQYGKLTIENARRLLKFWQVRAADAPPKTGEWSERVELSERWSLLRHCERSATSFSPCGRRWIADAKRQRTDESSRELIRRYREATPQSRFACAIRSPSPHKGRRKRNDHAALVRSASRCFSRGITSCFSRRSELCHASGLCL